LFQLENARQAALPMVATMIQSAYRAHQQRGKFLRLLGAVKMQAQIKAHRERVRFAKEKATIKIQAAIKSQKVRADYGGLKGKVFITRNFRKMMARRWINKVCKLGVVMGLRFNLATFAVD
jgi:myosin heavy subunit